MHYIRALAEKRVVFGLRSWRNPSFWKQSNHPLLVAVLTDYAGNVEFAEPSK